MRHRSRDRGRSRTGTRRRITSPADWEGRGRPGAMRYARGWSSWSRQGLERREGVGAWRPTSTGASGAGRAPAACPMGARAPRLPRPGRPRAQGSRRRPPPPAPEARLRTLAAAVRTTDLCSDRHRKPAARRHLTRLALAVGIGLTSASGAPRATITAAEAPGEGPLVPAPRPPFSHQPPLPPQAGARDASPDRHRKCRCTSDEKAELLTKARVD